MKFITRLLIIASLALIIQSCGSTKEVTTSTAAIQKVDSKALLAPNIVKKYMNTITEQELKDHLYTFASDAFEGRGTGTRGQQLAAKYLSDYYYKTGLKGPLKNQANPYLQSIPFLEEKTINGVIRAGNVTFEEGEDFLTQAISSPSTATEIVFVGHGLETEQYNDYAGLDVKGKAICAIWGEPKDKDGKNISDMPQDSFLNLAKLSAKGITDLFITMPSQQRFDAQKGFLERGATKFKPVFRMDESDENNRPYNLHFISPAAAAKLFGISPAQYFSEVETKLNNQQTLGGIFSAENVNIEIERPRKFISAENVVAVLEGSDLKDEVVVISSHYDHVGIINGKIYNGADDDGSGTIGVLEIAQAFKTAANEGKGPRRTVVFLNVTGEEKGLWGSEYYTDVSPVFPLANTVADFNVDMIGRTGDLRKDDKDYIYCIGSDMLSTELHAVHEKVSSSYFPDMDMDYYYNGKSHPERIYYRSDHYNFAKNNVPVIFYYNGGHEDYHQHTDTPDKINYRLMAKRAKLIFATAWNVANMDKRPTVDVLD